MENKARYTLVGVFVLFFTVCLVAFALWLAKYGEHHQKSSQYRMYVKESVSGLSKNSLVFYKGLEVGIVKTIHINPNNLEEIEIIINIYNSHLIKEDTYAKIESQGVTGNKTIELSGGTQDSKVLPLNNKGYAIIPVQASLLSKLTSQASNITDKMNITLEKINKLLNEENINNFNKLLKNTELSSNNFNEFINELRSLVQSNVKNSMIKIDTMSDNVSTLSKDINTFIKKDLKHTLKQFERTLDETQDIDIILDEFKRTLEKINTTLDDVNENKGNMFFETREISYGPGENQDD